ncbi:hypothetical protein B0J18DRAFT_120234 [Chaetomium sp. MPI-SDFR-AT-0129]|nr:hypothetical protein B0J18DRAFT_120234 [Chaetomium sp. MPI-SDFR-AT-0129]
MQSQILPSHLASPLFALTHDVRPPQPSTVLLALPFSLLPFLLFPPTARHPLLDLGIQDKWTNGVRIDPENTSTLPRHGFRALPYRKAPGATSAFPKRLNSRKIDSKGNVGASPLRDSNSDGYLRPNDALFWFMRRSPYGRVGMCLCVVHNEKKNKGK